jgi:hypothetical protein
MNEFKAVIREITSDRSVRYNAGQCAFYSRKMAKELPLDFAVWTVSACAILGSINGACHAPNAPVTTAYVAGAFAVTALTLSISALAFDDMVDNLKPAVSFGGEAAKAAWSIIKKRQHAASAAPTVL